MPAWWLHFLGSGENFPAPLFEAGLAVGGRMLARGSDHDELRPTAEVSTAYPFIDPRMEC